MDGRNKSGHDGASDEHRHAQARVHHAARCRSGRTLAGLVIGTDGFLVSRSQELGALTLRMRCRRFSNIAPLPKPAG
jgi:hypothetical protein